MTFTALSDGTRRAMIHRLSRGAATVRELSEPFDLSQQMISKHRAYLVRAKLVVKEKRGRENLCALRAESVKTVSDWALRHRQLWEERFDRLDAVVQRMKEAEAEHGKQHRRRRLAHGCRAHFRRTARIRLESIYRTEVRAALVGIARLHLAVLP
ncbi:MAG: ArsR/SmtB family transcription factor [Candidatus Baltobacteraceae bacterium]